MSIRAKRAWLGGGLALLAVVGIVFALRPRSLLEHAVVIANVSGWEDVWLSDHEYLLYAGVDQSHKVQYGNLVTGVKTRMPDVEAALNRHSQEGILPSPDGKWLMGIPFDEEPYVWFAGLDGKRFEMMNVHGDTWLAWIPGGHRWIDMRRRIDSNPICIDRIQIGEVGYKDWREILRLREPFTFSGSDLGDLQLLVTPEERLVVLESIPVPNSDVNGDPVYGELRTHEYSLGPGQATLLRTQSLHLPEPMDAHRRYCIAPEGTRIAWANTLEEASLPRQWLHRFFPRLAVKPVRIVTLSIAASDGQGMRELGSITPASETEDLTDLQWLPGGKRISFRYTDKLYTIAAD